VTEDARKEFPVSAGDAAAGTLAFYFASPGADGYALLKQGGSLEVVTGSGSKRIFQSDLLRVLLQRAPLAFHVDRGFAVVGPFLGPLVLVHEEEPGEDGRDSIYAVPKGLGMPIGVDYSPNGRCIEVRTQAHGGNIFAYHLVLDANVLAQVARRLAGSPRRYEARALCGFGGGGLADAPSHRKGATEQAGLAWTFHASQALRFPITAPATSPL
jgi:hypothetical protein